MVQFDTVQKFSKDGGDAVMKSLGVLSQGAQTAAAEIADYTKRSFEQVSSMTEKLVGARSLDKAVEIQTAFVRSSYESFVAQASKMGELATNTTREAFAPMENLVAKTSRPSA